MNWIIERYQFWKGIDGGKTCWHYYGYISDKWENMQELVEFLEHNNPDILLRIVRRK